MSTKGRFLVSGFVTLAVLVFLPLVLQSTNQEPEPLLRIGRDGNSAMQKQLVTQNLSAMPLAFTENQGQWDEQALFRANAGGATMWFTSEGTYYQFTRRIPRTDEKMGGPQFAERMPDRNRFDPEPDSIETMAIKASFVGANPNPVVVGEEVMEYKCNYFLGNDPAKWHTDVPNYQAICLKEVYSGIDLKYYGNGRQMEYDFIVSPVADPSQIRIEYEGAKSISINDTGELVVETDWTMVVQQKPKVFQVDQGERKEIEGQYDLLSSNSFGFKLSEDYNPNLPLVIDPIALVYSTYLGGYASDYGYGIAVDGSGNAYVTGLTESTNFPTQNPYQANQPGGDVFVTKLNSDGNGLVYSTYLGGDGQDISYAIAVDESGNAYVTGFTFSDDFPTQNPYQTDQTSEDVFVTKLNSAGNGLVYSTYLGGDEEDYGFGIAVGGSGNAYVTGGTWSLDFPTQDPYQTDQTYSDVFVTKLNSAGNGLVYSTYLGGDDVEAGYGIAVDGNGNAYVTGETSSTDFPTQNHYQTNQPDEDAFVTKLNSAGNGLVYSTYLGGSGGDEGGRGIAVDGSSGNAYVTGITRSSDFPTQDPFQTNQPYLDGFVTKMNSAGNGLVYSTYLGGEGTNECSAITIDGSGNAYVTGYTSASDFPTQDPYQTDQPAHDVFVTKLNNAGSGLVYSTYLGGTGGDYGWGIAIDGSGNTYVTGTTYSYDTYPTQDPYQSSDYTPGAFVTKLTEEVCDCRVWGDVTGDGQVNPQDVTYIQQVVYFQNDLRPVVQHPDCPYECGDVNCSGGAINPVDVTFMQQYVFFTNDMFCGNPCAQ